MNELTFGRPIVRLFSPQSFTFMKSSFLSDDRLNSRIYSVRWDLLITMPSWLASDSKHGFHKTFLGRKHSVPFPSRALSQRSFFNFCCLFRQHFSAAYLLKLFLLPQHVHTTLSRYQVWQTWAYSLVFVQLACWHTDVSRWSGGQPWQLSLFHRKKHCWSAHTSLPAYFQCSHCVALVPFCIICCLHLIAVWFLQAIWLLEWPRQLPSFLA